jgi:protein TonB
MFVPTHIPTGPIRASVPDIVFEPVSDTFAPGIPGVEGIPGPTIATLAPAPRVDLVKPAATVTPAVVADPKPLIVSSTILAAKIIKRVVPSYPLLAKQARVSGTVRLQATLSKDGRIENLRVIDGPPLLRQAALDAVRQWIYSPTILNGKPVEVEAPIEVNFTLN